MTKKTILLHIILGFTLFGCTENPNAVDVSGIEVNVPLMRFEQDLFTAKGVEDISALQVKYPDFYDVYLNNIMPGLIQPDMTEVQQAVELYKYVSHPDMDSLYKLTQQKFGNFDEFEDGFIELSKHIKHYFPEENITGVTTFVSAFEYASVFDNDKKKFGVGLDMYMGRNFEVYGLLNPQNFPRYRVNRFESYYILPNAVKSFLNYKIPTYSTNTFVEQAVYEGVVLYGSKLLLPNLHDSLHLTYTQNQIEWCETNEENIWTYVVESDLVFNTDKNQFLQTFFNDGPFTSALGNESSPRIGAYVGLKIVESFMKRNPEMSYAELLALEDYKKIFSEAKYRP